VSIRSSYARSPKRRGRLPDRVSRSARLASRTARRPRKQSRMAPARSSPCSSFTRYGLPGCSPTFRGLYREASLWLVSRLERSHATEFNQ
jgi:hypothetical protein